jgi:lipopolysaccharide export system permease protein
MTAVTPRSTAPVRRSPHIPRLGVIERYVLVQQSKSLAVSLAVIAALVMLIDFVEVSRGLGSDQDLSCLLYTSDAADDM